MKKGLFIILALFFIPLVSAADINLDKTEFIGGETLVAHISIGKDEEGSVVENSIKLEKDSIASNIVPFLLKEDNKNYYIYFDIPKNTNQGTYQFTTKVQFLENDVLKESKLSEDIKIDKLDNRFNEIAEAIILDNINEDFQTTAFSALALKNVDPTNAQILAEWIHGQMDNLGCFPINGCTTKDTVIAFKVLEEFSMDSAKTKNWLDTAKNEISEGKYTLILDDGNGECTIGNQEITWPYGTEQFSLEIFENTHISCSADVQASVTYSYLGNQFKELYSAENDVVDIEIDQEGCYGSGFKNGCNEDSTIFATVFLEESSSWLETNFDDQNTLVALSLNQFSPKEYYSTWLSTNRLVDGSYPISSSDSVGNPLATAVAYKFSPDQSSLDWLKSADGSLLENSQMLYLAFSDQEKVSSISVSPGAIVNAESGTMRFTNKRSDPVQIDILAPAFVDIDPTSFTLLTTQEVDVTLNEKADGKILVQYGNRSLNVLIASSSASSVDIPGDETTIEIVGSRVQTEGLKLEQGKSSNGKITVKNTGKKDAENLKISIQGDINQIITTNEESFNLEQGEEKEIILSINENKNAEGKYSGQLIIRSASEKFLELPLGVEFLAEKPINDDPDTPPLFNDNVPKPDDPIEEETRTKGWRKWLIIGFILILGIAFFWAVTKRKGKGPEMSESDQKILNVVNRFGKQE